MTKKLWGGRFKKEIDKDFFKFQKSIQYDYALAEYDLYHSALHIKALRDENILTAQECGRLWSAFQEILTEIKNGQFKPDLRAEDIHTEIQNRVQKKVGDLALKMHTLRSRNDQIVFDEKRYCVEKGSQIANFLLEVIKSLSKLAVRYSGELFIGFTHTQRAQVIYFSDYICAYENMFARDYQRLAACYQNIVTYIGAGAMAGSSLNASAYHKAVISTTSLLKGKIEVAANPIDSVSDRDFIIEFLSILSIIQMHLSRFSEDLILYSTKEFNYIDLPEEFCTGSSLMPHKKNPDFLELIRGYTGRIYGNLMAILTTMKALPLSYNRDMQLDKEPLFSSVEIIQDELKILAKFIPALTVQGKSIAKALEDEGLYATELAEFLVKEKGVPFKEAHTIIGKLIRYAHDEQVKIKDMPDKLLRTFHVSLAHAEVRRIICPQYAVKSKKSFTRKAQQLKRPSR